MIYSFERDPESGIMLFDVMLDVKYEMRMAFDTGASRTTFDINALLIAEYPLGNILEESAIETANGIVKVGVFEAHSLTSFGHTVGNVKVQVYDFLAHGILSDYDGVLGLDFFENTRFSIDMTEQTIEVLKK